MKILKPLNANDVEFWLQIASSIVAYSVAYPERELSRMVRAALVDGSGAALVKTMRDYIEMTKGFSCCNPFDDNTVRRTRAMFCMALDLNKRARLALAQAMRLTWAAVPMEDKQP